MKIFYCFLLSLLCLFFAACRKDDYVYTSTGRTDTTARNTPPAWYIVPEIYKTRAQTLSKEPEWEPWVQISGNMLYFLLDSRAVDQMPDSATFRSTVLKAFARKADSTCFYDLNALRKSDSTYKFPPIMMKFEILFSDKNRYAFKDIEFDYWLDDKDFL